MRLSELTNEMLSTYKYPNLMAEVKESTYSICTIAEHIQLHETFRHKRHFIKEDSCQCDSLYQVLGAFVPSTEYVEVISRFSSCDHYQVVGSVVYHTVASCL